MRSQSPSPLTHRSCSAMCIVAKCLASGNIGEPHQENFRKVTSLKPRNRFGRRECILTRRSLRHGFVGSLGSWASLFGGALRDRAPIRRENSVLSRQSFVPLKPASAALDMPRYWRHQVGLPRMQSLTVAAVKKPLSLHCRTCTPMQSRCCLRHSEEKRIC